MKIWVDAQLSPAVASRLTSEFLVDAVHVRDLGLKEASDVEIFFKAREANAVVMTKDLDFVDLQRRHGPPPQVLWITCGNTSNQHLMLVLRSVWLIAAQLLDDHEPIVEIADLNQVAGANRT